MWLALRMASAKIYGLFDFLPTGGAHSIASAARRHGVLCENVADVNDALFIQKLKALGVDLIISVSCPQIFEKDLITLSKMGCLNIHGAPLPKYRGLLPSFWMMTKGEELAAVTIFLVNEKIDAGDVVLVEHFPIYPDESLHRFLVRSKRIHCEALLRAITLIDSGASIKTYPLEINAGSYFGFPKREDYLEFVSKGRSLW